MNPIRRALTRRVSIRGPRGKIEEIEVPPTQKLIFGMYFAVAALMILTCLEVIHLLVLRTFNNDILTAISLLIGTILGAIFGQKG